MILRVMPDASYLSRPNAGSVAGSHHFLGHDDGNDPQSIFLIHPIFAHTTRIPVVCSSVFEAKYAGLFSAAHIPHRHRRAHHPRQHGSSPATDDNFLRQ
jgi:hypothetical protein